MEEKQTKLDNLFIDIAERISQQSYGRRLKVGAVIVKNGNIISMGWNGTPSGMDNNCEIEQTDGTLTTRPEVLHGESNALMKLAAGGGSGAEGSTLYVTHSPCPECAKLIKQAKVARVVYRHHYRLPEGVTMLEKMGVKCTQLTPQNDPSASPAAQVDLSSPARFPTVAPQSFPKHDWKDISHGSGGHNGEYDYQCRRCGETDWIAYYGTVDQLRSGPCIPKK